jgi:hypothetical protein
MKKIILLFLSLTCSMFYINAQEQCSDHLVKDQGYQLYGKVYAIFAYPNDAQAAAHGWRFGHELAQFSDGELVIVKQKGKKYNEFPAGTWAYGIVKSYSQRDGEYKVHTGTLNNYFRPSSLGKK